jgi:hypothetical protein
MGAVPAPHEDRLSEAALVAAAEASPSQAPGGGGITPPVRGQFAAGWPEEKILELDTTSVAEDVCDKLYLAIPNHRSGMQMPPDPETLDDRVRAVRLLIRDFRAERYVYLVLTGFALVMLLITAGMLMAGGKAGRAEIALLCGSGGSLTFTANRLLRMWNDALRFLLKQGANT